MKGKIQKVNINERLKTLIKWVEKCLTMKPEKDLQPVKYKYLFYDEYNESDIIFKEINDLEKLQSLCRKHHIMYNHIVMA